MASGKTSTLATGRYGEGMTPGEPWQGIEDTIIKAPGNGPIIGAVCRHCRELFLTADPAKAVNWSIEHAHAGDMFIVEMVPVIGGEPARPATPHPKHGGNHPRQR